LEAGSVPPDPKDSNDHDAGGAVLEGTGATGKGPLVTAVASADLEVLRVGVVLLRQLGEQELASKVSILIRDLCDDITTAGT
jgi:hypothetical protein